MPEAESFLAVLTDEELLFFPSNAMISLVDLFKVSSFPPGPSGVSRIFCASIFVLENPAGNFTLWGTEEEGSLQMVLASGMNWFHLDFTSCPAFWSLPTEGNAPPGG